VNETTEELESRAAKLRYEIAALDAQQSAIKIALNSLDVYGA
jgi:hypothetical protein